jgi:hypothetical protein
MGVIAAIYPMARRRLNSGGEMFTLDKEATVIGR